MVRHGRDMTRHGDSWEEVTGAILHIDALQGIGVVTHPEFVEATKAAPVGTGTTAGTALDYHILILGTDAVDDIGKALMVSDVEMTLVAAERYWLPWFMIDMLASHLM